jgi:hypothetical protein
MKIPDLTKVGANDVAVQYSNDLKDKDGDHIFGLATPWMNLIELSTHYQGQALPEGTITDTYFHEITHIINATYGLELEEHQIIGLTGAWLQVIRDNDLDFRGDKNDIK